MGKPQWGNSTCWSGVFLLYITMAIAAQAQTFTTLLSFDRTDGDQPAGLVQTTDGNFYGTTYGGGASDYGTVFSLSVGLRPFVKTQPTSGKEGAKIGILGQGFKGSSAVKFGGTKATKVVLSGTTFITATVPAEALTGAVTVTTSTTTLTQLEHLQSAAHHYEFHSGERAGGNFGHRQGHRPEADDESDVRREIRHLHGGLR